MEEARDRLRIIRRELKLNQGEFAERMKISQSMLSGIEIGRETLTDRNIRLICLEFGVNEYWLRNGGPGPIFKEPPLLTPDEEKLLAVYEKLEPDRQEEVQKYAEERFYLQDHKKLRDEHWEVGLRGNRLETVEVPDEAFQEVTPEEKRAGSA